MVVPCWPPHRRFVVRSCSARAASPLLRRAPAGVYVATCEARPACDARRTASSFVRFLPPLLTPHGGAASPPSFTRAGAAGEARDTPHCATRDARRAPRAGPVTVALRPLVPWVSRFLLLPVTLGLALSYICMCAMRRPRLARELNFARSAQKKKKNYLKKRKKNIRHPPPCGLPPRCAFVRAVEDPRGLLWPAHLLGFGLRRCACYWPGVGGLCVIHHQPPCPCFVLKIRPLIREIRPLGLEVAKAQGLGGALW